ncbi:MAG: gliding motility-associated peptidyl-prolyl isomerase GldI [Winogradskyella sp.]|uniref:gliding motility-associated peptidyl-prolyl isomerase GldI n=1 Tax=Winogradskyella sp. TaxID=1883156 RepID=UPI000F3ABE10|nr:gliding motility-associated peptidyl-prolyl isomerase GldI [Winogradskyella sp.]RNC86817.1 MAG: gliding motility-associated peptidyl-prolyl isomerase GldI [Winogradskyella sp.]
MKNLRLILIIAIAIVGCKSPEPRRPVSIKTGSFIKESAERNKALNKIERQQIETLIAGRFKDKDFLISENGFWYHYNLKSKDDTITPKFGDQVVFNYDILDLNGQPIYTSEELGVQDYLMDKEELFTGLREGLKLMKAKESLTFIFPSHMAFGYYGDENKIGTNVPLICNVTLNKITKNNND